MPQSIQDFKSRIQNSQVRDHCYDANNNFLTPFYAVRQNNLDLLKKEFDKGFDCNTLSNTKWNLLYWAASRITTAPKITKYLLEKCHHIINTPVGFKKITPLMMAVQNNHTTMVDALLRRGADFRIKDSDGKTALDHANQSSYNFKNKTKIVELLTNAASQSARLGTHTKDGSLVEEKISQSVIAMTFLLLS